MLGADTRSSGPRFIIPSGDSRFRLKLRQRAHYAIWFIAVTAMKSNGSLHAWAIRRDE